MLCLINIKFLKQLVLIFFPFKSFKEVKTLCLLIFEVEKYSTYLVVLILI